MSILMPLPLLLPDGVLDGTEVPVAVSSSFPFAHN
jgi:hypothetical protein